MVLFTIGELVIFLLELNQTIPIFSAVNSKINPKNTNPITMNTSLSVITTIHYYINDIFIIIKPPSFIW